MLQRFSSPVLKMKAILRQASRSLVRDFHEVAQLQTTRKGPGDFVTAADRRTERSCVAALQEAYPDLGILSEEAGWISGRDMTQRFVLDPIDGTRNFMHHLPFWCIALSLEHQDPETGVFVPVAAVIEAPLLGETFLAEQGRGAWRQSHHRAEAADAYERLVPSRRTASDTAMVSVSIPSPIQLPDALLAQAQEGCERMAATGSAIRALGSAALSLAYLAAGRLDAALISFPCWWDISAGLLLAKESGITIPDWTTIPQVILPLPQQTHYAPLLLSTQLAVT